MVLCGEESIENVSEWRVVNRNREIGNFSTSLRLPFTPSLQVVKSTEENLQGHFSIAISLTSSSLPCCVFSLKTTFVEIFCTPRSWCGRKSLGRYFVSRKPSYRHVAEIGHHKLFFCFFSPPQRRVKREKVWTIDFSKAFL